MSSLSLSSSLSIYVIGESHSDVYASAGMNRFYIPACTMYRICRDGISSVFDKTILHTDKTNVLVVVFGEIDLRCHVYKQIQAGRDEDEVIRTLASRYISTIVDWKESCNIIVRGVVPPLPGGLHRDNNFPIRGELHDRKRWHSKLNAELQDLCIKNMNISMSMSMSISEKKNNSWLYFLPSPEWVEDEHGFLRMTASDGVIHINNVNGHRMRDDLLKFINDKIQCV